MIADSPNAAPVLKIMDKLVSLMSKDQAERLGTASRRMQIVPSPRLTGIVDAGCCRDNLLGMTIKVILELKRMDISWRVARGAKLLVAGKSP